MEEIRREFWDAWNGLSEVHTQEALESQSEKMWAARERLLKVDPEFRAMIKDGEDKANAEAEARRIEIKTKFEMLRSEAEAESRSIISAANAKANAAMRMSEAELNDWAEKHRFKTRPPEEAEVKSKLICPICHGPDMGNKINGKPACIPCRHELVPESELKNYNRDYRRRWKKSRGRHS